LTVVPIAEPPFSTTCEPPQICTPLARPYTSCSPALIVAERSEPPAETISCPPSPTLVRLVTPPEKTVSTPPLRMVVLTAEPPDSTSIVSPELSVMPMLVTPELTG
jgi:hypothetical protein